MVSSTSPPVSVYGTGTPRPPRLGLSCLHRCPGLPTPRKARVVLASRSTAIRICLYDLPTSVNRARLPAPGPPQDPRRVQTFVVLSPNINGVSITYGSRPRLRPDYPAAECPCGGTLRLPVGGVRAPRIVTHTDIRTCGRSTPELPLTLHRPHNAPLPLIPKY